MYRSLHLLLRIIHFKVESLKRDTCIATPGVEYISF